MTRQMKLVALVCAQSLLLAVALPALAAPPPPAAPDGGPDYIFESGPVISHSWNPGGVAGGGIQSSSAMGQAQAFSTGSSGGRGNLSSAQSLVIAHRKAQSQNAKAGGSSTTTAGSDARLAGLVNLMGGNTWDFYGSAADLASGNNVLFSAVADSGGTGVDFYMHGESHQAVDVTALNQNFPGTEISVEVTGINLSTADVSGTFTIPHGESAGTYSDVYGGPHHSED